MPDYTLEQKAAAFDELWRSCGASPGELRDYVSRDISRPGCPPNEATILRVPRYVFEIAAEGEMRRFRDVLHYLATRERSHRGNESLPNVSETSSGKP